jgi:cytochrome c peroxidase
MSKAQFQMKFQLPILKQTARMLRHLAIGAWGFLGILNLELGVSAASLDIRVHARFQEAPLVLDALAHTNAAGQTLSVTRLDFLLSDFALRRTDGAWLTDTNWQAFVSVGAGRTNLHVNALPSGDFDLVRFQVGLRPDLNHADPAKFPPDHPLNPNLNGLHWGWAGGYVFLAIEGRWSGGGLKSEIRNRKSEISGYSFHLGNDPMLMTVERPLRVTGEEDQAVELELNVDRLLAGIVLSEESSSTHSREGDELAAKLKTNAEAAFTFREVERLALRGAAGRAAASTTSPLASHSQRSVPLVSPKATPYRFTFGAQFPVPDLPKDNPLTVQGVELGRVLFNDPLLSINGKQSCASCHQAEAAFVDVGKALSLGAEGQAGTRNAMPLFNLAWKHSFFWDGRARTLREQVLMPIENPVEMHESLANVVAKLTATAARDIGSAGFSPLRRPLTGDRVALKRPEGRAPSYPALFAAAFGTPEISEDRIARALEQFLLTLTSHDSKFDRALLGREQFTDEEKRGFELFVTEYEPRRGQFGADCFHCHGGPFFSNHGFANNGLDAKFNDLGLAETTKREFDQGRFAVPSLRNVALTAPYMHDGRFATLEEVVEHYSSGVKPSRSLDPNLAKHPTGGIQLSAADKRALVAFLKTLTDEKFAPKERKPGELVRVNQ